MTLTDSVKSCFSKYATFEGRATRSEFWYFWLFNILMGFILTWIPIPFIGILWSLATLIPNISVTVRRLHDTNHSGWWYWIALIPLIGWIWYLVLMCTSSTAGANEYGEPNE